MAPVMIMLLALFVMTGAEQVYENQQQHLFTHQNPPVMTTRRDNAYTSWSTTRATTYQSPVRTNTTLSVEKKEESSGVA